MEFEWTWEDAKMLMDAVSADDKIVQYRNSTTYYHVSGLSAFKCMDPYTHVETGTICGYFTCKEWGDYIETLSRHSPDAFKVFTLLRDRRPNQVAITDE